MPDLTCLTRRFAAIAAISSISASTGRIPTRGGPIATVTAIPAFSSKLKERFAAPITAVSTMSAITRICLIMCNGTCISAIATIPTICIAAVTAVAAISSMTTHTSHPSGSSADSGIAAISCSVVTTQAIPSLAAASTIAAVSMADSAGIAVPTVVVLNFGNVKDISAITPSSA